MMILFVALVLQLSLHYAASATIGGCSEVSLADVDATLTALDLSFTCGPENFTVEINTCILERMGYDPEQDISINGLSANDPYDGGKICSILEEREGDIFRMTLGRTDCNTQAEISDDSITYYNVVRNVGFSNVNGDVLIRRQNINLPFSCTYATVFQESGLGPIDPQTSGVSLTVGEQSGQLEGTLLLCMDTDCDEGFPIDQQYGVFIPVWQVVSLIVKIPFPVRVQIFRVWATRNQDPLDGDQHELYEDGCIMDPFVVDVATNMDYMGYISFHMFHWSDDSFSTIYFHATFDVCDDEREDCVTPTCGEVPVERRRRRRSSSTEENRRTLTIGPYVPVKRYNPAHDISKNHG